MITLLPDTPNLERPPRIREIGDGGYDCTLGSIAVDLSNSYCYDIKRGCVIQQLDWQEDVLRCWMSEKETKRGINKYAFSTCGLIVPRQNGKTKGVVVGRILAGMVLLGESIQFSAHNTKTTGDMWEIFLTIFGDNREDPSTFLFPELHELVAKENFRNGHEEIILKNGGRLEIVSRKHARTRGNTIDVYIIDEAQYLTDEQVQALIPAKSSAPLGNPQIIYLGTPPNESNCYAEVFERRRDAALAHVPGMCWHEWSVESIPEDLTDESIWYATNPSLGHNLLIDAVRDEIHDLGERGFAIERLCWWPESAKLNAVNEQEWNDTTIKLEDARKIPSVEKTALGIKFSPDGAEVCATMAKLASDGTVYSQLLFEGVGIGGQQDLIDLVHEMEGYFAVVAIDGRTGAGELFERLTRGEKRLPKRSVKLITTSEIITSTTTLLNGLHEKTVLHIEDETLDRSALHATRRKIGRDGTGFDGDSCALESLAIAVFAARSTHRKNRNKQ